MVDSSASGKRLIKLVEAFNSDGFEIDRIVTYGNRLGIAARSKTAVNYDNGQPKKVYYLEGGAYEAGFLMGRLAETEIERMTTQFTDKVVFSFIGSKVLEKIKIIQEILIRLLFELSKKTFETLPEDIREEIRGLHDGCKSRNSKSKVDMEHLIVLNTGIDVLCSMLYPGNFVKRQAADLFPGDFRIPLMCNAFTVCGKSAGGGCYFARDFMFPTADVFQDTAAMVVYNPLSTDGRRAIPHVSVTAPGMVGSIAAMNLEGVGFGVDMSPGANCDPQNVGINSLLMLRMCVQYCASAEAVVEYMVSARRGVSWNYIVADGKSNRSCVVEAGASAESIDFTQFPTEDFKPVLPDGEFIEQHRSEPFRSGIMTRWNDYRYPAGYLEFNRPLWDFYNKKYNTEKKINPDAFSEAGWINAAGNEKNCPSCYYFAPQREESADLLIVTNHYIIPEMRYFAMHRWTEGIVGDKVNDIQWRYDELNAQIRKMLEEKGFIDFEGTRRLVGFLSPYGENAGYYAGNPRSKDGKEIRIEGCLSVFDLKEKVVESRYGYFCDKWVRLTLPRYFQAGFS
jgi:hypothetical protein